MNVIFEIVLFILIVSFIVLLYVYCNKMYYFIINYESTKKKTEKDGKVKYNFIPSLAKLPTLYTLKKFHGNIIIGDEVIFFGDNRPIHILEETGGSTSVACACFSPFPRGSPTSSERRPNMCVRVP